MKTRNIFFKTTISIIFLLIGFRVFQLCFRAYVIVILNSVINGSQSSEQVKPIIDELANEQVFSNILLATWIVCFLIWFYISYKRAQTYSRQHFSYKPIWALFSLIIPVFNLFAPYKIMHEIWSAENVDLSQEGTGKKLINTWWFLGLILVVFSRYLNDKFQDVDGLDEFMKLECYYLILYGLSIHYFYILRKLLTMVNSQQMYRDKSPA